MAGDADADNKVDVICDAVRAAVELLPGGRDKYLTVVATSYARCGGLGVDNKLLYIICHYLSLRVSVFGGD